MKHFICRVAIVIAIFATLFLVNSKEGAAQFVVLSFDELPGLYPYYPPALVPEANRLSNQYLTTHGVAFSSCSPFVSVMLLGSGHTSSPPNGLVGSRESGYFTASAECPIVAKFFKPSDPSTKVTVSYVSVRTDLLGGSPLPTTLKAYDVNGTEIGSVTKPDTGGVVLSLSMPGIHEVRYFSTADNSGVAIDDFTFSTDDIVILNFDELQGMAYWPPILIPEESRLSDQYLSTCGVVFSSGAPFVAVHNQGVGHAPSPPNGISGSRPDGWYTNSSEFPIVAKFFYPDNPAQKATTNYVSITTDLLGTSPLSTTLKAFDVNGNEIGSVTKPDTGGAVLSLSVAGIHEVRFIGTTDWNGVGIDNFTFIRIQGSPVLADAGFNMSITSENQASLTIQGQCQNATTCSWREQEVILTPWGTVGTNGECPLSLEGLPYFPSGDHTLTLECRNDVSTVSDEMILTIGNSSPRVAPVGGGVCEIYTNIVLGGQLADFDGDVVTYQWQENNTTLWTGLLPAIYGGTPVTMQGYAYPCSALGDYVLTLIADDGISIPATASVNIKVVDTTEPSLTPVADKTILWPPNHKMVNITIRANARDNSGGPITLAADVSSNEPEDGLGDGDMSPDWTEPVVDQVQGIVYLSLRAERSGKGSGRVYTVSISATDASGNVSRVPVTVIVPHDQKKN